MMNSTQSALCTENRILDNPPIPEIVESDSPNRCQHSTLTGGQCRYSKLPAREYCKYHIAIYNTNYREPEKLKRYRLAQHHSRVNELAYDKRAVNLQEEIGMLNVLLEEIWNQCHTPFDFFVNSGKIENLVDKISTTMLKSVKLEAALGQSLNKQTLAEMVDDFIRICSEKIKDTELLKTISQEFGKSIEKAAAKSAIQSINKSNERS